MQSTNPTVWYIGFGVGAACVFAVVVAVVAMIQLSSRIAGHLAIVLDRLTTIAQDTAAVPMVGRINADVRDLNASLADTTHVLRRLFGGAA